MYMTMMRHALCASFEDKITPMRIEDEKKQHAQMEMEQHLDSLIVFGNGDADDDDDGAVRAQPSSEAAASISNPFCARDGSRMQSISLGGSRGATFGESDFGPMYSVLEGCMVV